MSRRNPQKRPCDYPGCSSVEAKRVDIKTNCFRGDDIVLNVCKEHRKPEHEPTLLQTEKARKQL